MTDALALAGDPERSSLRIWTRRVEATTEGGWRIPLRFRVAPGVWPDIELRAPEGTSTDVAAEAYELDLLYDPATDGVLEVEMDGVRVVVRGRALQTGTGAITAQGTGSIAVHLVVTHDSAAIGFDGMAPVPLAIRDATATVAVSQRSDNIADFRVAVRPPADGRLTVAGGAVLLAATVYGLRPAESALYRTALAATVRGEVFYRSEAFTVADGVVHDRTGVPALVPDRRTVVSPIRVVEEFAWRPDGHGDMTRVVDRSELWRSSLEPGRFPEFSSSWRSLDAAFALALETFQRNASGEFSLPGEDGLWSAGYFQGSGAGFGSWRRDTSHIALRAGNLIDPGVARASLLHVVRAGFDNGSDGDALPAVAVWDHVLASGDDALAEEAWVPLVRSVSLLDERFDPHRGLVTAPQSTSNDLFDEPEAGGFALSTEVYSMAAYAAMSAMARMPVIHDARADAWAERATTMKRAILQQFWNAEHGYFTSGPTGSGSHGAGVWETSGAEAAVWGFLGEEAEPLVHSVLAGARRKAMSDYGLVLFPDRDDDNHFCHSVWYCWQAGIARGAARVGDSALIHQLLAQQIRSVILNKTFYEVTDARTGAAWRWPGQLWHAAGFVSLVLFGVFGIRYDEHGMTFTPAVDPSLDGARIEGLRYRAAVLDIEIRGHGTRCTTRLDGRAVAGIDPECVGRHSVVLEMAS